MHYFNFNIKDWHIHTSHLSTDELGVYLKLLCYYYDTENPIPKKTQWVLRRLQLGNQEETVNLILSEFFHLEGDFWHNKRADQEIKSYKKRSATAKTNGKLGGRPKKENIEKQAVTNIENPQKTQSVILANPAKTESKANQEPITNNHKPITNIKEKSTKKEKTSRELTKRFTPPTMDEVVAYCNSRANHVDPERFIDHYTSNGWMVGKNKMKDWKASIRTWEKSSRPSNSINGMSEAGSSTAHAVMELLNEENTNGYPR